MEAVHRVVHIALVERLGLRTTESKERYSNLFLRLNSVRRWRTYVVVREQHFRVAVPVLIGIALHSNIAHHKDSGRPKTTRHGSRTPTSEALRATTACTRLRRYSSPSSARSTGCTNAFIVKLQKPRQNENRRSARWDVAQLQALARGKR